jgi:hypothetical protein
MYCEGNFSAKDITVLGAMVVNGKNGAEGSCTLDNVRFVYNPGAVESGAYAPYIIPRKYGGIDKGWAYGAVSVNYRRAPNGHGWLANITAIQSRTTREDGQPDPRPTTNPLQWKNVMPAGEMDEQTWTDLAFPLNDPTRAVDEKGLQLMIAEFVSDWMKQKVIDAGGSPDEATGGDATAADADHAGWKPVTIYHMYVKNGAMFNRPAEKFSFSLNNLLADLMSNSRVLLWRPFE